MPTGEDWKSTSLLIRGVPELTYTNPGFDSTADKKRCECRMKTIFLCILILGLALNVTDASAQARDATLGSANNKGPHTLYGDFEVDEGKEPSAKAVNYEIVLFNIGRTPVARQLVGAKGRYRFMGLDNGQYELVVFLDGEEIGRTRVEIMSLFKIDFRQDLALQWRSGTGSSIKAGTVSAADAYKRSATNESLFTKAKKATDEKKYDEAVLRFQELLASDPKDFQAWSELGTVFLLKENFDDSEKAYIRSTTERPTFFLAQMNLGRLRILKKNFEGAIEPLTEAVKIQPDSADANYSLGDAYLQIKKGSKAVPHLNEAARLGRADAHLRLAVLYDAAKMKDRAAAEYEAFLTKRPDYKDRKTLEQYISQNKKQ